jgi:hypothetical protein
VCKIGSSSVAWSNAAASIHSARNARNGFTLVALRAGSQGGRPRATLGRSEADNLVNGVPKWTVFGTLRESKNHASHHPG